MSELTLYADSRLPCPQRALLLCQELDIDITIEETGLHTGQHKKQDFLSRNPFGTLPCLMDSSQDPPIIIYESRAIARYLAARHGSKLIVTHSDDPRKYALFEQAASIEITRFDVVANRLVFEKLFKQWISPESGPGDSITIDQLQAQLSKVLDILDAILEKQEFMAGSDITIVDIFYIPYMHHLVKSAWPTCLSDRPHLHKWWDRLQSRQCYAVLKELPDMEMTPFRPR